MLQAVFFWSISDAWDIFIINEATEVFFCLSIVHFALITGDILLLSKLV